MAKGRLRFQANLGKDVYWDPPEEFYVDECVELITGVREVLPSSRSNGTNEVPEEEIPED